MDDGTKWVLRSRRVLAGILVALPPLLSLCGIELPAEVREQLGGSAEGAAYVIGWGIAGTLWLWRRLRPDPRPLTALPRVDTGGAGKLGLVLLLAVPLPLACAGVDVPTPATPRQAFAVSLSTYTTAARGMAAWCTPARAASAECEQARETARTAQAVIDEVGLAVTGGTLTDDQLERAAASLDRLAAELRAKETR